MGESFFNKWTSRRLEGYTPCPKGQREKGEASCGAALPRARYAPAGTPGRAHAEACGLRAGRLWGGAHGAGAFHTPRLAGRKGR